MKHSVLTCKNSVSSTIARRKRMMCIVTCVIVFISWACALMVFLNNDGVTSLLEISKYSPLDITLTEPQKSEAGTFASITLGLDSDVMETIGWVSAVVGTCVFAMSFMEFAGIQFVFIGGTLLLFSIVFNNIFIDDRSEVRKEINLTKYISSGDVSGYLDALKNVNREAGRLLIDGVLTGKPDLDISSRLVDSFSPDDAADIAGNVSAGFAQVLVVDSDKKDRKYSDENISNASVLASLIIGKYGSSASVKDDLKYNLFSSAYNQLPVDYKLMKIKMDQEKNRKQRRFEITQKICYFLFVVSSLMLVPICVSWRNERKALRAESELDELS